MTDHEKEILDKIKQSTEKTPVPESGKPIRFFSVSTSAAR